MNRGKYILIIFLIFFILILATCGSLIYFELRRPPSVKTNSYLEIPLVGGIQEKVSPDFLSTLLNIKPPLSLYDIWMNFKKAKMDNRINSIVVHLGYMECDWGKINELRDCILDFKQSGKKVYAYIDETVEFDKEYFLATACDRIILHPMGTLIINGIGGYIPFFKDALDNLGVKAEVEHIGKYKTAYNMFTESDLTPAHREMLESIYEDIFQSYVKTIAEERNKTEEDIRLLIDRGYFQGEQALEAGLVDNLLYPDELQEILKADGTKLSKISHDVYTKIKPSSVGLSGRNKIAIIYGMGPILTGEGVYQAMGSTTVARWFQSARKDSSIAAVVFRVDSPGGSPVASDIIWREIILTKKEKPVVISMSDMAGSGGYWVSMSADKIVAHPQTLTGSIGVIFGKFSFSGFLDKIGVTGESITFGKRADIFSPHRKLTPEESAFLNQEIQWTYDRFV
ncbi:MAG: S49 family peptidase, partial [Candidatus Aminicenantes bacterium]|nr:S49 family peptidase [Candidatus Aminicenantes bacterium]